MHLHEILSRREQLRNEADELEKRHPDLAFPPEAEKRLGEIMTEAEKLTEAEKRAAAFASTARTAPGRPLSSATQPELRVFEGPLLSPKPEAFDGSILRTQAGAQVPMIEHRHRLSAFVPPEMRSEVSVGQFIRAWRLGPRTEAERRVLAESSIGTGGALVPHPLSATLIDAMIANAVCVKAGVRIVPMTAQTLDFARVTELPLGAFRAENTPLPEDAPAFDRVQLVARTWGLVVRCSRELLEDGTNTSATIEHVIGQAGGLAADQAVLNGPGGVAPLGIIGTPGVQTITGAGAIANWNPVLDAVELLANADSNAVTAIVMSPSTARAFGGLADTTDQPLMPPPSVGNVPRLVTTSMPNDSMLIGDFSRVYVGVRTQLSVTQLNERYAELGQVGFVAWMRMDVAVTQPPALCVVSGITSTAGRSAARPAPKAPVPATKA